MKLTGWWFGTLILFFHNIWDNPSPLAIGNPPKTPEVSNSEHLGKSYKTTMYKII
jgi:hypothetical protein